METKMKTRLSLLRSIAAGDNTIRALMLASGGASSRGLYAHLNTLHVAGYTDRVGAGAAITERGRSAIAAADAPMKELGDVMPDTLCCPTCGAVARGPRMERVRRAIAAWLA